MNKKNLFAFALFAAFSFLAQFASAQTVYVTEKGKKFHKKNCSIVNEGKKGVQLAEAKKMGLEPCGACKPESPADKPKKK